MELDYMIHEDHGSITYTMTAYESKTGHIKNGKWTKYITRSDTQKSLELLKQRHTSSRIHETSAPKYKLVSQIKEGLKEVYSHLRLGNNYFYSPPIHALRHIGAHYWLEKTNYNYGLVAIIGG